MERRNVTRAENVTFIETPSHLLPLPLKLSPLQDLALLSWDLDDDTLDNDYSLYDDVLRDIRGYARVLDFTNISASTKTPVACRSIRKCRG